MTAQPATAPPSSDLLPCPFGCAEYDSNDERLVILTCHRDVREDYDIAFTVRCNYCGIEITEEYQSEVIAAWNRRAAIPDDKAELLAVLRDVYNSACTNKDAVLKARALLAKHGES